MDQLEYPDRRTWESRRDWFERLFDVDSRGGAYVVGEHAIELLVDLQSIYCVGAFSSVVVMSCTIVDAHLREVELGPAFKGGFKSAFQASKFVDDLEWLRKRRNALVHYDFGTTHTAPTEHSAVRTVDDEEDARRAISAVADVLFECPFV